MLAALALAISQSNETLAISGFNPLPLILAVTVAVFLIGGGGIFVLLARERNRRGR